MSAAGGGEGATGVCVCGGGGGGGVTVGGGYLAAQGPYGLNDVQGWVFGWGDVGSGGGGGAEDQFL